MTGFDVYHEIVSLATGTQVSLIRTAGWEGDLAYPQIEAFVLNFAEWCLDEDGGPFESWMDAWNRFVAAGMPGYEYALREARWSPK